MLRLCSAKAYDIRTQRTVLARLVEYRIKSFECMQQYRVP